MNFRSTAEENERLREKLTQVEPDLRQERTLIEIALENHSPSPMSGELRLRVEAPSGGATTAERSLRVAALPGVTRYTWRVDLPRPPPWSCRLTDPAPRSKDSRATSRPSSCRARL